MNVIDRLESQLAPVSSIPASGVSGIEGRIGAELDSWDGIQETHPRGVDRLTEYWSTIDYPGWHPVDTPWSAAFVSYALRGAGFPQRSAHYQYVEDIAGGTVPGWTAYSIPKAGKNLELSPGDVLIRARGSASSPDEASYYWTHGDVVWKVENGLAYLVGGNLSDSAMVTERIPVSSSGQPTGTIKRYKVILKKKAGSPLVWLAGAGLLGAGIWFWKGR